MKILESILELPKNLPRGSGVGAELTKGGRTWAVQPIKKTGNKNIQNKKVSSISNYRSKTKFTLHFSFPCLS